jgi:NAD(P)-dependent dehydrogenase (short-subunit alcohol dehydrogenase family)
VKRSAIHKTPGRDRPVAIVTGAGKRVGRQIALALARESYNVIVNYNESAAGASETVARVRKEGGEAHALRADISNIRDVRRLVRRTIELFGKVDLLVNNSAVFLESPLESTTEKLWDRTLDINLKGTFLCSQAVAREMLKRKRGKIINIASLGGIQAWSRHLPYSVSKAGVIMLTRCLAKALAPYVQVNAIAPGTILLGKEEDPHQEHVPVSTIPLKRYGEPPDVTDLVLFLALKADYMTGQVLVVDGGRSIP